MRPVANHTSVLSSPGSIRHLPDYLWWVSESIQPREEANSCDSVETEVMEAQHSLPPLFAIQIIPCPRIFSCSPTNGHCQTGCWSHFLSLLLVFLLFSPSHFQCLLKTEEMKQVLHVKRSQMVPLGAARWLSVEVKTDFRPIDRRTKELFPERAPASNKRHVPQPQPQAYREGCLQALPGGWTDGKVLAGWPSKANSLLKLLYEGLANVQRAKKGGGRREKNRNRNIQ